MPIPDSTNRSWKKVKQRASELRKKPTCAESVLWDQLRNRRLFGLKFRRQHPLGPFIADFYCAECRLVVELDGPVHAGQVEQDSFRDAQMTAFGYRVLRFKNDEVEKEIEFVLKKIEAFCNEISPRPGSGEGRG